MQALDIPENNTQPFGSALDEARRLLDSYAAAGVSAETLSGGLVELCAADPEASWAILAWLDQYHRRGIIDGELFRELKSRIARLAVAVHPTRELRSTRSEPLELTVDEVEPAPEPAPQPAPSTIVRAAEPPPEAAGTPPGGTDADAPTARFAPGTVLRGRYELVCELGRGGMGTVYRARDRERRGLPGLGEFVALKVLREDWVARPDALAALRQECFRAQSLSHPNIVNVYDWDRDGETCFVTMELVDGELLSRLLDRLRPRRLARRHALAIIDAVGNALAHAHGNGVVHADLKPANVIVGHDGRVRVLDFGLARPVLREPSVDGDGNGSTLRAATPAYASPDVLRGVNPVPRDDIFSFACIAYELLGGAAPFERQTVKEARRGRPMPRRPQGCTRRDWRALRRALSPQREERPATVTALLEDLLGDDVVERVPPLRALVDGAREPRRPWLPWVLATSGLAAAAAVGGFAYEEWGKRTATDTSGPGVAVTVEPESAVTAPAGSAPERSAQRQPESVPAPAREAAEPQIVIETAPPAVVDSAVDARATGQAASRPGPVEPTAAAAATPRRDDTPTPPQAANPVARVAGPAVIHLDPDTLTIGESDGVARITLVRTGALDRAVDIRWWTEAGEAVADEDYADFGARIERLAPGQSRIGLLVPLVADAVRESTETFSVAIAVDAGQARLTANRATIIVVDDD